MKVEWWSGYEESRLGQAHTEGAQDRSVMMWAEGRISPTEK
jgi:hypothetical protein